MLLIESVKKVFYIIEPDQIVEKREKYSASGHSYENIRLARASVAEPPKMKINRL